jgi:hypothetical protein
MSKKEFSASNTDIHVIAETSWKDKPLEIADQTADRQAPGAAWGLCYIQAKGLPTFVTKTPPEWLETENDAQQGSKQQN